MIDGPLQACVETGVCVAVSVQIKSVPLPESLPNTLTEGEDTESAQRKPEFCFCNLWLPEPINNLPAALREGGWAAIHLHWKRGERALAVCPLFPYHSIFSQTLTSLSRTTFGLVSSLSLNVRVVSCESDIQIGRVKIFTSTKINRTN